MYESGARDPINDPLTELARLIGQRDSFVTPYREAPRRDSFAEEFRDLARDQPNDDPIPEEARNNLRDILAGARLNDSLNPPETNPHPDFDSAAPLAPDHHDDLFARRPVDDLSYADTTYDEQQIYTPQSEYGQVEAEQPLYGDDGQLIPGDTYPNEQFPAEVPPEEEAPARGRKGLFAVVAVFGLAVLGTAGAYAYRTMYSGPMAGAPPLIRADGTPNKIAASQSGDSNSGKQITDRLGTDRAANERVVSREEQPVDVRAAQGRSTFPSAPSSGTSQPASGAINSGWPAPAGTSPTPSQGGAAGAANSQNEPKRIRTIPIRSDQLAAAPQAGEQQQIAPPAAATSQAPPPAPPRERTQSSRPATTAAAPAPSGNAPLSLNPQSAGEPRAQNSRVASAPPRAAEGASGAYYVQLAAHKTQEEASAAYRSAQSKYPDLMRGRKLHIKKKEVGDKGTFYGAQVGPFATRSDANQMCDNLKSAGASCLVERN